MEGSSRGNGAEGVGLVSLDLDYGCLVESGGEDCEYRVDEGPSVFIDSRTFIIALLVP